MGDWVPAAVALAAGCCFFVGSAIVALRSGTIKCGSGRKRQIVRRFTDPLNFWAGIALNVLFGGAFAIFLVGGLLQSRQAQSNSAHNRALNPSPATSKPSGSVEARVERE
jgi:hypothetical protein